MRNSNYNGPIKLNKHGLSLFFNCAALTIHAEDYVPAKPIIEPSGAIAGWFPSKLGNWWGRLLIEGHEFYYYNDFGIFRMETDLLIGDILIQKIRKQGIYTRVWFDGSGALIHD